MDKIGTLIVASAIVLGGCATKNPVGEAPITLPSHIEAVEGETLNGKPRKCFSIDEVTAGVSRFIITLCEEGGIAMSNEGDFEGEICGIHEFIKQPRYQLLFPYDENARICQSDVPDM